MSESNYKSIFKSTSVFGGVKLFQILVAIIRAKIVALFLGTNGMGISALLTSTTAMVQSLSELGLSFSIVKDVSESYENNNTKKYNTTIVVFLRLLLITGLSGAILIIILSSLLSQITFDNTTYYYHFILLSIYVFFTTVNNGLQALFQGTRKLKEIALTTILSSTFSIIIGLPLYYYFKVEGIVPALIISSFFNFFINYYFSRDFFKVKIKITKNEFWDESLKLINVGIIVVLLGIVSSSIPFFINTYITQKGTLTDLGLYQAGLSLTTQYLSVVFSAMTVDYYPRLSAINKDNEKIKNLANQQSEIMLLVILPLVLCLMVFVKQAISILLTPEFIPIVNFVRLMGIGMFLQASSYSMGLIAFAKGDKKNYMYIGLIGNVSWLLFTILGYNINGIEGIGQFYIIHSIFVFVMIYHRTNVKYSFKMNREFSKIFYVGFFILLLIYVLMINDSNLFCRVAYLILFITSCVYFFYQLDKKIGLYNYIISYFNKNK